MAAPFPSEGDAPRLQQLFPTAEGTNVLSLTIITVPEVDVQSVQSWKDGSTGCWLRTQLPLMIPDASVHSFEPGLRCTTKFSWQQILYHGDRLLEEMLLDHGRRKFHDHPIVFIAHGFGGLIIKRAISVLSERSYDAQYRSLLSIIAGVILLGCPSPKGHRPRDLEQVCTLLKSVAKHSTKLRRLPHIDVTASISQRFSESGFEAPILSVFENTTSKISRSLFSQRQVLVNSILCETHTKRERVVGVDSSHDELSTLQWGSPLAEEISGFITMALDLFSLQGTLQAKPSVQLNGQDILGTCKNVTISEVGELDTSLESISLGRASPVLENSGPVRNDYARMQVTTPEAVMRPSARLPCYFFPHERNHAFFGRSNVLEKLDQELLPPANEDAESSLRMYALCGVGGVGKTQIATEFVFTRNRHFDAIFWLHAGDNIVLANEFTQIARKLGLQSLDKTLDNVVARNLVLQWLSDPVETTRQVSKRINWLVVFDNVEKLTVLKDYWPDTGSGSILITSRDPFIKTQVFFHSSRGMDLEPFTQEEASNWLRWLTHYNAPDDKDHSDAVVEKLSRLPLAIAQVAGAMLRRGLSFAEFLEFYTEESFRAEIYQSWQQVSHTEVTYHSMNHILTVPSKISLYGLHSPSRN